MPKGEEFTTKFKVDISDLRKNITEAGKQIKLANATFKAATSGMDSWGKSADGISAKLKQLDSVLQSQKTKLQSYKDELKRTEQAKAENSKRSEELRAAYQKAVEQYGKNSDEAKKYKNALNEVEKEQAANEEAAEKLRITVLNQEGAVAQTEKELGKYSDQLDEMEAAAKKSATASEQLEQSISDQESELKTLKKQYADIVLTQGEESDAAKECAKKIKDLSNELNENKSKLKSAEDAADDLAKEFDDAEEAADDLGDSFDKIDVPSISNGFTIIKGALANLVADGFRLAIDKAKEFASTMIESAASVKAETAQFEQTFGSLEDKAGAAIGGVAKQAGILDTRLKTTGTSIYAFAKASGMDGAEALKMMEEALTVTADSAAYYDRSLEDVSESLTSFLKGNYSNDAALGVSCTETTRNTAANKLFGKSFKDLSEAQKQLALLEMVKDANELSGAMGQASREADGWENVTGNLKESWRQFTANVGTSVLEELTPVIQDITTKIIEFSSSVDWQAFGEKVSSAAGKIKDIFLWVVSNSDAIIAAIAGMVAGFAAFKIGSLVVGFIDLFKKIKSGTGIMAAFNAVTLANPIVLIVAAIVGLIAAFVVLWNKSEAFRNFWIGLWEGIKSAFGTVVSAIAKFFTETIPNAFMSAVTAVGNFFTNVITFFSQLPGRIAAFLGNVISNVASWTSNLIKKGIEAGSNFISNVIQFFQQLPYKIGYIIGLAIGKFLVFGIKLITFAKTEIPKFVTNVINFIKQLPGKFATWLTNTIAKVAAWGVNLVSTGREKASNFITSVINFIKELPGKIWTWLTNTITKVVAWGTDMAKTGREKASDFLKNVINNIKSLPGKVYEAIKGAITKVIEWGTNLAAKGRQAASDLFNAVVNGVKELPSRMLEIGGQIVNGVWQGIVNAKDQFMANIKNFFSGLVKGAKDGLGIKSPSRVFRDQVGKQIVAGIQVGIGKATAGAMNTMSELCNNLLKTAMNANENYKSAGASAVKSFEKGYKEMLSTSSKNIQDLIDKEVSKKNSAIDKKTEETIEKRKAAIEKENKALKKQISKNNKDQINEQISANNKALTKEINQLKASAKKKKEQYAKSGKSVMEAYEKAMSAAADKIKTTLSNKLTQIAEEAQAKYDEIAKLQDSLNQKLSGYGDLFTRDESNNLIVSNINDNINTLKTYGKNLEALKGKISDELMNEIAEMNVQDAVDYTAALLQMSADELKAYNDAYTNKINTAKNISASFYKEQVNAIKTEYTDKVKAAFADVETQLQTAGQNAIEGFIKGMTKKAKKADKAIKKITNSITKAMNKALKINSPSKVFEQIGVYSGEGYEIGFVESLKAAKKAIIAALPTDISGMGSGTSATTTNKVYNFYQTNNSPKALSRLEIYRQTKNQLAFAKGV